MPDGVEVQGPDGKTYEFPAGTDKQAAIGYFKKKGIGVSAAPAAPAAAGPKTPPPAAGPTGARGVAAGAMEPIAEMANAAVSGAANLVRKAEGKSTMPAATVQNPPSTPSQTVGRAAEGAAEFVAGEGALKAMGEALKLKDVATLAKIAKINPTYAKMVTEGMKAFGIGTALSAAHSEEHPVKQGALTGVAGALGEGAASAIEKIGPRAAAKASTLMNRYIGLSKSDLPKWDRFKPGSAEDIGKTVLSKVGIKGSLAEQHAAIEAARDQVNIENEHMIANVKGKLVALHSNLDAINFKVGQDLLEAGKLSDAAEKGLKAVVQNLKDPYNPNLTVQEALKLRRTIGNNINWSALATTDNPQQLVYGELYKDLNEGIKSALPPDVGAKFASNNRLQQRLIIAREAAGEQMNKEAISKSTGTVSKLATMAKRGAAGAAMGAVVGAVSGGKKGAEEDAGWGALIGGVGYHGLREIGDVDLPAKDIGLSKAVSKVAPKLAKLARSSPAAARALQAITAVHGGGSGALASQP